MKNIVYYSSSILFTLFIIACSSPEKKADPAADTLAVQDQDTLLTKSSNAANLDTVDVSFFKNAAYGGMFEVESSHKILQSTKDEAIKTFATMMTKDHGNANQQLKTLAESKGYLLPKALPESKIQKISEMNALKEEGRDE